MTRRKVLSRTAWGTAPVVLATLAIINPGAQVSQVDLHDGTVWLTNEAMISLGRYNPAVEELNAGLVAGAAQFDVLQDGIDVLLLAQGMAEPAFAAFERALQLDEDLLAASFNRAVALDEMGRFAEGHAAWAAYLEVAHDDLPGWREEALRRVALKR